MRVDVEVGGDEARRVDDAREPRLDRAVTPAVIVTRLVKSE